MPNIENILRTRTVILDGACGTQLQKRGMPQGICPEIWCLQNPEIIKQVHSDYKNAGADVIYTCTFGANRLKLDQYSAKAITLSRLFQQRYAISGSARRINSDLALLARAAAGSETLVAGDIGPTGEFVEPFGPLKFEQAVNIFKEQAQGLIDGGVDIFVIETMMDIQEARAALIAVRELTDKFTMVTMTFEKDGRTLNGTEPAAAVVTLQSLGAGAVGCNCSAGPKQMVGIVSAMKPYATVPIIAKPNAGMPELVNDKTVFNMPAQEFASFSKELVLKGANILGGCCGTTPQHIKELKNKIAGIRQVNPLKKSISAVSSARKSVLLDRDSGFTVVGEVINPTGKKELRKELSEGKMNLVRRLSKEQEGDGAQLLDINAGAVGINEKETILRMISALSLNTALPLVIDSADPQVIEAALRLYPGRALINSLSGEKNKLQKLLPVAVKYGAMFILLPIEEKRIPREFKQRKKVILDILKQAQQFGFTIDDIIVDGLTMAVASDCAAALETLKTINWCSSELGVNTIVGLSNISFGLPQRKRINSVFLSMAKKQGLSMAIMNPGHQVQVECRITENLLMGKDSDSKDYISLCSSFRETEKRAIPAKKISLEEEIFNAILEGDRGTINLFLKEAVSRGQSVRDLLNNVLLPAITKTGDLFDKKEYFLPQLTASAETMEIGVQYLAPYIKDQVNPNSNTVVILATVKDDIHDIGKNIVALMLKNHGFTVIDLGKDVSAGRILRAVKQHKAAIVGLSALMTTTMINMEDVINRARSKNLDCRFIIGGAVVTKAYAVKLGAEYGRDGVEAVRAVAKMKSL